ncbi:hypothetical protein P692DRAFT_20883362 [Suillus brevipes Sb2]|nr:hypothetical protein P692DRAFT_20883362 [Suillus brevipes Sb2]
MAREPVSAPGASACALFTYLSFSYSYEGFAPPTMSSNTPAAEETKNLAIDNVKSFITGGFGGVSAILGILLTKTRLQAAALGAYNCANNVVRKTLTRDGVTGAYRGMVLPLLGVTPIFAVSFWRVTPPRV